MNERYDFFISYARENMALVKEKLFNKMKGCRMPNGGQPKIFFDEQSIQSGDLWPSTLENALQNSDRIVLAYSGIYFHKPWCRKEMQTAFGRDPQGQLKVVCPILIEANARGIIPLEYSHVQANAIDSDEEFERLARVLGLTVVSDPPILSFHTQPAAEATLFHTLPPVRVTAVTASGKAAVGQEIRVTGEGFDLRGTLSARCNDKGVAEFAELSAGQPPVDSARIIAQLAGSEPARSSSFKIKAQPVAREPKQLQSLAEVIHIETPVDSCQWLSSNQILVNHGEETTIYTAQGLKRSSWPNEGVAIKITLSHPGHTIVASWHGKIRLIDFDGALAGYWDLHLQQRGMAIPGGVAFEGDTVLVGMWSGKLYRLTPGNQPGDPIFNLETGIQGIAQAGHHLVLVDRSGQAGEWRDGRLQATVQLEKLLLDVRTGQKGSLLAIGESQAHQWRPGQQPAHQKLGLGPVFGAFSSSVCPVIIDSYGHGVRITSDLGVRTRFHTTPGAFPVSADDACRWCVFQQPDGLYLLMDGSRVIYTHRDGPLAVAPDGKTFAVGNKTGLCLVQASDFISLVAEP